MAVGAYYLAALYGCAVLSLAGERSCSRASNELLDFTHNPIKFVDEISVITVVAERGYERTVVPRRPILFAAESIENFEPMPSKIGEDRPGVMEFV